VQIVNLQNPLDLGEEPLQQPEIPTGDPDNRGDGFGVGEFRGMQCQPELGLLLRQDKLELFAAQRSELMDEANPGVELRIPCQAFFDPGHANQDQAQLAPVIEIPYLLQAGGFEPVGFIDDDELGVVTVWSLIEEIIGSTAEGQPPPHERVYERTELRALTAITCGVFTTGAVYTTVRCSYGSGAGGSSKIRRRSARTTSHRA
jgi:hypothetical protein